MSPIKFMKIINKYLNAIYILIILFLSILLTLPYFHSGYFPTHDGLWAVVRTSEMYRELKDLQIPPRMSEFLNFGYGYPLFNFDYPFPYYLAFIFHIFRLSFINSTKLVFAITVPISMIFMYLSIKEQFKNKTAALISSIMYGFYPYRLVDLYVRGSIGESLGFAIFPILFYLSLKIKNNSKNKIYSLLFGFSLACLILSHNIMAVLFAPIIFIICAIFYFEKRSPSILLSYVLGFLFALGFAFYFFVPALFEKNLIRLSIIPIANRNLYYATLKQLVIPSWGYGIPGDKNSFSYQIGFVQLLVFLIGIFIVIFNFFKKKRNNLIIFAVIYSLFIIFLQFKYSSFFWVHTPLFREINYPWTYLAPLGFLLSLITGFVFVSSNKIFKIIVVILSLILIIYYLPFAKPQKYISLPDSYYFTNSATTTSSSEVMPLWVKQLPFQMPDEKALVLNNKGTISNLLYNSKKISFTVNTSSNEAVVRINQIYYPGWVIYLDNKVTNISYNNLHGVMDIKINKGIHFVNAKFEETSLRLFADMITVITFLGAILVIFLNFKKNKK